jgi:hypothetical protein
MLSAEFVVGKEQSLHGCSLSRETLLDFRPVSDVNDVAIGNKSGLVRARTRPRDGDALHPGAMGTIAIYVADFVGV